MAKRKFLIALLALMILISPVRAAVASMAPTPPSEITADILRGKIEEYVSEHADTTAGLSVSVFDRESAIYSGHFGYADMEANLEVDANTVMEWGSVTKLLVWVSVMQLSEQGKLDLEADIRQYLPEDFLTNLNYDIPVTMLHLMNHNAGFEDTYIGMMTARKDRILTLEEYLIEIQPQQVFEPGKVTAYSNWGVALAGYIVEQISGVPFYSYVHEHIFAPLKMEHSALNAHLSDNAWVSSQREKLQCYTTDGDLIKENKIYIIMYPAGMCTSTLEDFRTFAMALLNRESPLFSDPATYDEMMSATGYYGDTQIGLNYHGLWAESCYSAPVIGHGGNTIGCSAQLLLDIDNGIGMVVMTNQSGESIFCIDMPELVFGKSEYEPDSFSGYVTTPRSVFRGPLKLYKAFTVTRVTPQTEPGVLTVPSEIHGVEKITIPYGDYLVTSVGALLLEFMPLLLWAVALAFCLVSFPIWCIGAAIRKLRGRKSCSKLQPWAIVACVLQIVPLFPTIPAILRLFGGNQWAIWQYKMLFGAFLLFVAVYAVLAVYGLCKLWKKKRGIIWNAFALLSLLISIWNIFYWELCYFWMI